MRRRIWKRMTKVNWVRWGWGIIMLMVFTILGVALSDVTDARANVTSSGPSSAVRNSAETWVRDLVYIQDERTGICFARFDRPNGGMGYVADYSAVACEGIPFELLIVVK